MTKSVFAFPTDKARLIRDDGSMDGLVWEHETGMTLRDYFAAKAMIAIASSPTREREFKTVSDLKDAANTAYAWADAMIAERDKL